jgi:membrane protease YdiL (CAAX protease family)
VSRNARLVPIAGAFYGPLLAAALLWGWLRELWPHWWHFDSAWEITTAALAGCLMGAAGVVLSAQLTRTVPGIARLSERISMLLAGQTTRDAVFLALFSSFAEEFLFRGCIQSEFGFWPATVLFAAVHIGRERLWLWWTASAFVAGIGLGVLYEQCGGLLAPIVMHFVINVINIRILSKQGQRAAQGLSSGG